MPDPLEQALSRAREARERGQEAEAERLYSEAAGLAGAADDRMARAFALRHLADLARGRGDLGLALASARQAVSLYRAAPDRLALANALRQEALALEGSNGSGGAAQAWAEARSLYAALDVAAGVAECDQHLARPDAPPA